LTAATRPVQPTVRRVLSLSVPVTLAVLAAVLGVLLRPHVLYDDAAISMRYAYRIAFHGTFTYNDHQTILGASNPLYTLLLAVLARSGLGLQTAATTVCLVCYVGSVLLVALIVAEVSNPLGGAVGGLLLVTNVIYRTEVLSGMESGLAVVLGLLTIVAILHGREDLGAVFLGLAVWNKPDAFALALGVGLAWLVVRHKAPWRVASIAAAVVLPWMVFASFEYGSPIPHSLRAKLRMAKTTAFDHRWMVRVLQHYHWDALAAAALLLVFVVGRLESRHRQALLGVVIWFAAHLAAFSLVNLGAPYPWYLAVLFPPLAILAGTAVGLLAAAMANRRLAVVGLALAGTLVAVPADAQVRMTDLLFRTHHPALGLEAIEEDRRAAGEFLGRHVAPHEIVESCYGWIAYGARNNPFDDICGLNTVRMLEPVSYVVIESDGAPPSGMALVASFARAHAHDPTLPWFEVFAAPRSALIRAGVAELTVAGQPLRPPG
jgi:MFS family permease